MGKVLNNQPRKLSYFSLVFGIVYQRVLFTYMLQFFLLIMLPRKYKRFLKFKNSFNVHNLNAPMSQCGIILWESAKYNGTTLHSKLRVLFFLFISCQKLSSIVISTGSMLSQHQSCNNQGCHLISGIKYFFRKILDPTFAIHNNFYNFFFLS